MAEVFFLVFSSLFLLFIIFFFGGGGVVGPGTCVRIYAISYMMHNDAIV